MKTLRITAVSSVLLILFVLSGCDFLPTDNTPTPVTIAQRIGLFEDALNTADRTNINQHFHDDTLSKQNLADQDAFTFGPLPYDYALFSIDIPATIPTAEADGTVIINTTFSSNTVTDESISFVMKEGETDVWYIYWLTLTIGVDTYEIRKLF